MFFSPRFRLRSGFTLIEVLISLVIIGILSGTMMMTVGAGGDKARAMRVLNDMKTLSRAAQLAYADGLSVGADVTKLSPYISGTLDDEGKYTLQVQDGYLFVRADLEGYSEGVRSRLATRADEWNLWQDVGGDDPAVYDEAAVAYLPVNLMADAESLDDGWAVSYAGENYSEKDFEADFVAGTAANSVWPDDREPEAWEIADEGLIIGGSTGQQGNYLYTEEFWGDLTTDFSFSVTAQLLDGRGYGIYFRASEGEDGLIQGYRFQLDGVDVENNDYDGYFTVRSIGEGSDTWLTQADFPDDFDPFSSHVVQIQAEGEHFTVTIDPGTSDSFVALEFDDATYAEGVGGFRSWAGNETVISDVSLETLP